MLIWCEIALNLFKKKSRESIWKKNYVKSMWNYLQQNEIEHFSNGLVNPNWALIGNSSWCNFTPMKLLRAKMGWHMCPAFWVTDWLIWAQYIYFLQSLSDNKLLGE